MLERTERAACDRNEIGLWIVHGHVEQTGLQEKSIKSEAQFQ